MPRHRSERGGADVVTPFSESREAEKVVSVIELLDQFKAETEPDPPQQPKWETVNGTGDSVLDKFSNVATWSDILMPLGWTEAKVQDSDTLEAWKCPGGTDPISAKVPKVAPGTIVVWSTDAGLPCWPDQKVNKPRSMRTCITAATCRPRLRR